MPPGDWSDAWVLYPRLYIGGAGLAATGLILVLAGQPLAGVVILGVGSALLVAGEYYRRVETD